MDYFRHDINASEDDKILELLEKGGYEYLGYYWRFIEYLYSRGGKVNKQRLNAVAWSLHMNADILSDVICSFGLFGEDEEYIYSERVVTTLEKYEEIGKRMSEIGRSGGQASAQARAKRTVEKNEASAQAEVKRTVERTPSVRLSDGQARAQQNKIKENKKEKKERMNEIEPRETRDRSSTHSVDSFFSDTSEKEYNELTALGGIGKGSVLLSQAQIDSLLEQISLDEFNRYVEIVADAELNGKKYKRKTHYQAILDMVEQDRKTTQ